MKYRMFIGVDVSKETLDFVVFDGLVKLLHMQVSNDKAGISRFYKRLIKDIEVHKEECLFCLEHTGIYCNPFLTFASAKDLPVWLEDAKKIKVYHGLEREKNDALDALRIAEYGSAKFQKVQLWSPPREEIQQLKAMIKLRERLVSSKKSLLAPLGEEKQFGNRKWAKEHDKLLQPVITEIVRKIKGLEQKIKQLINEDSHLKELYEQVSSVKGVGLIVSINILVVTNEFKQITDPRKMACNCGVAPFKKDSGKSVKGKSKVSHRANKSMKTLFNLAARAAVRHKGELRDYYLRKVAEGKNKMSVMNAVRNKIIHRIFACVRDGRKYEDSYLIPLLSP
ncbi:MAG: IS110 family transposase [Bacteroidota bacterium]